MYINRVENIVPLKQVLDNIIKEHNKRKVCIENSKKQPDQNITFFISNFHLIIERLK